MLEGDSSYRSVSSSPPRYRAFHSSLCGTAGTVLGAEADEDAEVGAWCRHRMNRLSPYLERAGAAGRRAPIAGAAHAEADGERRICRLPTTMCKV